MNILLVVAIALLGGLLLSRLATLLKLPNVTAFLIAGLLIGPSVLGLISHEALASMAIEEAVRRHAGTIEETYTMMGQTFVQEGKNLTKVKQIVVTGGSLIHTKRTEQIAAHALFSPAEPTSLRPKKASVWVDRTYILAAMGLLSTHYPQAALRIMKKELEYHGYSE